MRLWSLDPSLLDASGLVACWRETLLAQKVLAGLTRGYTRHPQLERWREHPEPVAAVGAYLEGLHRESLRRAYRFDASRITARPVDPRAWEGALKVTTGQLSLEHGHLLAKLAARSPELLGRARAAGPTAHPIFRVVEGPVAAWERA